MACVRARPSSQIRYLVETVGMRHCLAARVEAMHEEHLANFLSTTKTRPTALAPQQAGTTRGATQIGQMPKLGGTAFVRTLLGMAAVPRRSAPLTAHAVRSALTYPTWELRSAAGRVFDKETTKGLF